MGNGFTIMPLKKILQLTLDQLDKGSYFGIKQDLFLTSNAECLNTTRFGHFLENPLGVAAGPHTQLTQNIVGAWLCGARYIELKTIQTLDELEVSKPCIDMQDEGYNCEWSQELRIHESYDQYLNAWILIHLLRQRMGLPVNEHGVIFNMSAGYDLKGIKQDNVQWFLKKMSNCKIEKDQKLQEISGIYPEALNLDIPDCISDNITLSTMHGCPPDEIGKIAHYLITEQKLHTVVKLNPTLLGPETLREILNNKLAYKTPVPDEAFQHDISYNAAINLIKSMQKYALDAGRFFGIKLTNTLESKNFRGVLPESESMMYMSGRALHPITVAVALKLQLEFKGSLDISFSGGADCFNFPELLACGLTPVTVCTDLLKPGGYGRLHQYIEEAEKSFSKYKSENINEYICRKSELTAPEVKLAALKNLAAYAGTVSSDKRYKKGLTTADIKTPLPLSYFDCINAPCSCTCPSSQDIPAYLHYTAKGEYAKAASVILQTNPFPTVTGLVCDHPCQTKCTRVHYDEAIRIRDVKYFITRQIVPEVVIDSTVNTGLKIAVIGAGPSGLSCAWFLKLAGCAVTIFEEKPEAGGMVSSLIPEFRLPPDELGKDLSRIRKAGIKINYNSAVDKALFEKLCKENNYVYVATGAPFSKKIKIPGSESKGVLDPLKFLADVKMGLKLAGGKNIVILGGGNTAMDTARTAKRLVKDEGTVTVVYRRTLSEMPAGSEEISACFSEGIQLMEMVIPLEIISKKGDVTGLKCCRTTAGMPDESGRPSPVIVEGSDFILNADIVIPALGQDVTVDFVDLREMQCDAESGLTRIQNVFIGGDARRGASSVIKAIADGRKTAQNILKLTQSSSTNKLFPIAADVDEIVLKKARKRLISNQSEEQITNKPTFNYNTEILSEIEAKAESEACLACDIICNNCVSVCPNFANYSYQLSPKKYLLKKAVRNADNFDISEDEVFSINQAYQIVHFADFCNECGNCNTFCPTRSAPYKEKPALYFSQTSFNRAENGYFFTIENNRRILLSKKNGSVNSLSIVSGKWRYETPGFRAVLDKITFAPEEIYWKDSSEICATFKEAAIMQILFEGIQYCINAI